MARFTLQVNGEERTNEPMIKTLDQIDEVIRNPKHPFRQVADRPEKPQKHRYERRKIKEYIRAAEWSSESK
jgi:hypothetical protein